MNPQFVRATALIVAISSVVFAIGATLLVFAFRAFRTAKSGDVKHVVLLVIAIGFVLASCVGLLVWSALQRG